MNFFLLCLRLFWEFFKTGLFAVGGGMATIPFLEDMAEKTGWFTSEDLANMIAVGESTPGPIGVNMATYVGFVTGMGEGGNVFCAITGAVTATLGLITPSIMVILIIALMLKSFRDNKYVNNAFYGLRPASTGLIAAAGLGVLYKNLFLGGIRLPVETEAFAVFVREIFNWKGFILAVLLWILTNLVKPTKKLHPIVFIAASAVVGVLFGM